MWLHPCSSGSKAKQQKSGRSYQLCLQLFCQEEFLRRLEKSKYAENLVLKGGLFLYNGRLFA